MVFDDRGKVTAMKAYWSAADVTQLSAAQRGQNTTNHMAM